MNTDTLRSFLLLHEAGSITKAAEQSYQSSQGLNYAITSLENEIGAPLFERTRKGVILSKYGKAIINDIQQMVEIEHNIQRKIGYMLQLDEKSINIGVVNSLNIAIAPILFDYYRSRASDEHLYIEEFSAQQLNEAIADGRIDIGFSFDVYSTGPLHKVQLTEEGWCLLCNNSNDLATRSTITFDDLKGRKIAIANHNYKDFDYITNLCRDRGIRLEIMLAFATGDSSVISFLENDIGVMLCATYIARAFLKNHDFHMIPILEGLEPYHSCLLYRHDSEITKNILDLIRFIQEYL